ncbi:hypothetical protein LVD15_04045 [Fulvivirga maritima]|uniref:hypothetical protein n=1 Tax=Fulvivirga maritima TaxID=2904247 RepID=UPI001F35E97C|nr:hypothetical protein [Fulvivirga maritima]UII27607.1 hypothetical protein LVD15_04045 [Fulvivirga maritima]
MNKMIIMSMGLPLHIQNKSGKKATIEFNKSEFVVCKYHPDNPIYINDASLLGWYPRNPFKRVVYFLKQKMNPYAV